MDWSEQKIKVLKQAHKGNSQIVRINRASLNLNWAAGELTCTLTYMIDNAR
jgi:hypothetical protein